MIPTQPMAQAARPLTLATLPGWALVLAGAVTISFSAVWVKLAHVGPTTSVFYRVFFGGIFLSVWVMIRREHRPKTLKPYLMALVAAIFFFLDLSFFHFSIHYVGPGLATILSNLQVFFLAGYGTLILKEKLSVRQMVSIPLAVVGLMLLFGVDWSVLSPRYQNGVILGVFCALTYAVYLIILRRAPSGPDAMSPGLNMAVISLFTAVMAGVEVRTLGEQFTIPDTPSWLALLALGLFSQTIGWQLIAYGISQVPASQGGLILLMQPALAFMWDVIIFGRSASPRELAGAGLALTAIYLGSHRTRPASKVSETSKSQ